METMVRLLHELPLAQVLQNPASHTWVINANLQQTEITLCTIY